jgi:hypothetical protein
MTTMRSLPRDINVTMAQTLRWGRLRGGEASFPALGLGFRLYANPLMISTCVCNLGSCRLRLFASSAFWNLEIYEDQTTANTPVDAQNAPIRSNIDKISTHARRNFDPCSARSSVGNMALATTRNGSNMARRMQREAAWAIWPSRFNAEHGTGAIWPAGCNVKQRGQYGPLDATWNGSNMARWTHRADPEGRMQERSAGRN